MSSALEARITPAGSTLVFPLEGRKAAALLGQRMIDVRGHPQKEDLPFPRTILLGSIPDARLRVLRPIRVELSRGGEGESVIASVSELEEFGQGPTSSDALRDLGFSLAELFLSLQEDQSRLGPDLVQLLGKLLTYLALYSH